MKYRTKLYLTFTALVLGTILLAEGFTYFETKHRFFEMLRAKVIAIASTAAIGLDVQKVEAVKASLNDQSPEFLALSAQMRKIRNANRTKKTYVSFIYILEPNPKNPKEEIIVVSDSTEGKNYAPPGTVYHEGIKIGILDHLNEVYSPQEIESDRWGRSLPAYVPLLDAAGNYVATLAVNLTSEYVLHDLNRLTWITLIALGLALGSGLIAATFLSRKITHSLNQICAGVASIGSGELQTRIEVMTKDEFAEVAKAINQMTVGLQERDQLKLNFVRYVSKHILEKIMKEGKMPALEGEKKKVTILFSDIRHFSELAETLPPEQVVTHLNEFLSAMIDVIFEKNGTLDKFIGDGLMIEFGAPLEDPEQEKHAVETAIAMQRALYKLNKSFESRGLPKMEMIVGIHTGNAILGNIGSEKRMEYTAIGDTVNTAARIGNSAKKLDTSILISEATWAPISNQFQSKDLGPIHLRGKAQPIKVFSIEFRKE